MHKPKARSIWRTTSITCLTLLPVLALFHFIMWSKYTRTLLRPETGDLKRMGYLVGLEDCKARLVQQDPKTGFIVLGGNELDRAQHISQLVVGDSFADSLSRAWSAQSGEAVGVVGVNWELGNGLANIKSWVAGEWFRRHGIRSLVVERTEYAWLDTFADEGIASPNSIYTNLRIAPPVSPEPPISQQPVVQNSSAEPASSASNKTNLKAQNHRARPWTFANNGNYKILFCNLAFLCSPTGFDFSDTVYLKLTRHFFNCSYGNHLLCYREDARGALTNSRMAQFQQAVQHLKEVSDLCQQNGIEFHLIIPPVKSYLYYDWVDRPFYPDSKLLETLRVQAAPYGYVDLKHLFHQKLSEGYQDLYYPDDSHWNYPAAAMAAAELAKKSVKDASTSLLVPR